VKAPRVIPLPVVRLPLGSPPPADHRGPFTIGDLPPPRASAWDRAEAEIEMRDNAEVYAEGDGRVPGGYEP
jgi:hypothetical protein